MAIEDRNLGEGTVLVAKYKGKEHRVLVLADADGKLGFELDGKTIFKSLSSAGKDVMGGVACNGWRFWTPEGEVKAAEPKPEKPAKAKATKARTVQLIKKVPNQKGVVEGSTKWFCSGCMKGFVAEGTTVPEACPEGHPKEETADPAVPATEEATTIA